MTVLRIERRFVPTASGTVHVAECGTGDPVLLFHQTPRSWTEFRYVLPLLGRSHRAIAMDTRGFGDSDSLAGPPSIEAWSLAALELADALGLDRFTVSGHHTGAFTALETAVQAPERVEALVLSAMSFVDAERRARHGSGRVVDDVERRDDGGHLLDLWRGRLPDYPQSGRIDLLEAFVVDALKAGPMAAEGHRVVNRYRMEDRIGLVTCPTLILAPTADQHAYPSARRVRDAIPGSVVRDIPGAMVPFPDQMPDAFASAVADFLIGRAAQERRATDASKD